MKKCLAFDQSFVTSQVYTKKKYLEKVSIFIAEAHSEPFETTKIERFAKIFDSYRPLTVFTKRSILDLWQAYASVLQYLTIITSINYLIICTIVKYVVTERFWCKRE